jgi:hypothetical protein
MIMFSGILEKNDLYCHPIILILLMRQIQVHRVKMVKIQLKIYK